MQGMGTDHIEEPKDKKMLALIRKEIREASHVFVEISTPYSRVNKDAYLRITKVQAQSLVTERPNDWSLHVQVIPEPNDIKTVCLTSKSLKPVKRDYDFLGMEITEFTLIPWVK